MFFGVFLHGKRRWSDPSLPGCVFLNSGMMSDQSNEVSERWQFHTVDNVGHGKRWSDPIERGCCHSSRLSCWILKYATFFPKGLRWPLWAPCIFQWIDPGWNCFGRWPECFETEMPQDVLIQCHLNPCFECPCSHHRRQIKISFPGFTIVGEFEDNEF